MGVMDHQKKLDFVLRMTKHALESVQHFDNGGTALGGPVVAGTQNAVNPANQGVAGAVGNALGTNNNFQATGATISPGTNTAQLQGAYNGAQAGLTGAEALNNTLTPGVAQGASSQNILTNQLQSQALGGGPNPAQAALNQNTGQNIAQAAALAAGTRGAGTNAGLIASNAAQQGANTQQQAVGQGATLQAQQTLAAQNALENLAGTQVQQGTNAVQLNNQAQQNEQNILQGANTATNNANVSQQENINSTNAAVAAGNQNSNSGIIGGIGNAINSVGKFLGFAEGGQVPDHIMHMAKIYYPHLAGGGAVWENSVPATSMINPGAPVNLPAYNNTPIYKSSSGSSNSGSREGAQGTNPTGVDGTYGLGGQSMVDSLGATNPYGAAPTALQMPQLGAGIGSAASQAPSLGLGALAYAKGGKVQKMEKGGKVPGPPPKINHDAYSNDKVNAKLTPGEVVIDLDTLHDKGSLGKMARFVAANIERKKMGRKL